MLFQYHEGYLVEDCTAAGKPVEQLGSVAAAKEVRKRYWDAYERGEVQLVQRRVGFKQYQYLSTKQVNL
jgi:hypothetical protein